MAASKSVTAGQSVGFIGAVYCGGSLEPTEPTLITLTIGGGKIGADVYKAFHPVSASEAGVHQPRVMTEKSADEGYPEMLTK
jgi:hypothetical protein